MGSLPWHSTKLDEIYSKLSTSKKGLSSKEIPRRRDKYGANKLVKKKEVSPLTIFINQFKSFLVLLLFVAIGISAALGDFVEAIIIGVIVVANGILGFVNEFRAERSMEALRKLSAPQALVLRDGREKEIPASELVPGDIIVLAEGSKVPADCRLIESINLRVDEAALTGESNPVDKELGNFKEKLAIGERKNCAFMNTMVARGRGLAVVVDTGMDTEVGKIARLLQAVEKKPTPLQKKLGEVAKSLGIAVVVIAAVVFGMGVIRGADIFDMFLTAVSLAVAAVPEGLPAVVTITLAIGLSRMARAKSYVRKLPSVETLGSASVICSDKTGTLTKNELTVQQLFTDHKVVEVTGEGYEPEGEFLSGKKKIEPTKDKNVEMLLRAAALCTTSNLYNSKKGWYVTGDPTEGALIVSAKKAGLDKPTLLKKLKLAGEIPFDSNRKMMSVILDDGAKKTAYVKGAAELLLARCDRILLNGGVKKLTTKDKSKILAANQKMASSALRVLGVAYKIVPKATEKYSTKNIEEKLIFVGLQGMIDPPHEEVKAAIATCREAGITPVMITGDYAITAKAIALELGMMKRNDRVVTGEELSKMSHAELSKVVSSVRVFARVSPEHKVKIVQALKARNHVVAMTGDGVNDAPALKQADIGIAMGKKGTDVAKESSDMILGDDNFATIVKAVKEGRSIYDNIQKFIRYLLSSNIGEVLTIFFAALIGFPLPLIAVQLLWMNLLTDGFPALALGVDPPAKDIMKRKPRNPKEKTIGKDIWTYSGLIGIAIMLGTLFLFWMNLDKGLDYARSIAFSTIVVFQMINTFSSRTTMSLTEEFNLLSNKYLVLAITASILLQLAVIYVPFAQPWFGTTAIELVDWAWITGVSAVVIVAAEIKKLIIDRRGL